MTDTTQAVGEIIKTDGRMRVPTERRQNLLAEYEQSGLSAKKFAQLAGLKYQTFANWLQKRRAAGIIALPISRLGAVAASRWKRPKLPT